MYYSRGAVIREVLFLLLVTIFSQSLLALVSRHLVTFSFLTAWHCLIILIQHCHSLISELLIIFIIGNKTLQMNSCFFGSPQLHL